MSHPPTRTTDRLRFPCAGLALAAVLLLGLPGAGPLPAQSQRDPQQSAHLDRLGVPRWHAAGFRGRGVKVAVLDAGFRGYRKFLGSALPEKVTTRSFRDDGDLEGRASQHGILCGEVVHAVAPEAELLLANWEPDRPERFLDAVRWARRLGARVISCSLIMPGWSDGEGGGPFHAALADILGDGEGPGDPLFFASAGNLAQRHWKGTYRPDERGLHQWRPDAAENDLFPWGQDRVSVELYGPEASSYIVRVRDKTTGEEAAHSAEAWQTGRQTTASVARFLPELHHTYQVSVRKEPGAPSDKPFHLVVLGGTLEFTTADGSICCPADGAGVLAVGAVNEDGRRQAYSGCGPNSPRPKPDFVAPVPFASGWRARPFSGTSAAAPQAAGLAALWWSRHPGWDARHVVAALREHALDLGPAGHDPETGHGLIRLP